LPFAGTGLLTLARPLITQAVRAHVVAAFAPAPAPAAAMARALRLWPRPANVRADAADQAALAAGASRWRERLSGSIARTALIHGEADALTGIAAAHALQEWLPHARLGTLPDAGHMLHLTDTEVVAAETLRFARAASDRAEHGPSLIRGL
jgi:pimeloyl-ACP methyl ester carboxylesterase